MEPLLDCRTCGACCIEAGPVTVTPTDPTPRYMTRSVRRMMGYASWEADDGVRRMDRDLGGRCKQLDGEIGKSCRCKVYDRRPAVCREFEPGSQGCLNSREAMRQKLESQTRWRGYGPDWKATV